ncbi:glutamyl-tRNA reductase [Thermoplasma sp.]|uniref:glutamyl-tRNA reductase n=1 Tax=Thermoplasma sp. TaxID=1973142 RepID=UPI0012816D41|nr:glutamyl-tRNA reductase [Thermoplasma sp.]KAA8923434.1 MAG: glutamyl-tRNA reductase [Thermoplasma sp.]
MQILTLISWDFKRNKNFFNQAVLNPYEYWSGILERNGISTYVILLTCNRVEIYLRSGYPEDLDGLRPNIFHDEEAIRHIMEVSAGLDSMSLGESEILKQVKDAYDLSVKNGKTDKVLSLIFQKAISVGKKVRSDTDISRGKVSVPSIVYDILISRGVSKVLLIGNGMLAGEIAPYLSEKFVVTVAGRNLEHVKELASKYNYRYTSINDLHDLMEKHDAIIAVTSSKTPIIRADDLIEGKIYIDLGNPRNIEGRPGLDIITIDDIYSISSKNGSIRETSVDEARRIIDNEMRSLMNKIKDIMIDEIFADFYRFAAVVQRMEVEKFSRMHPEIPASDLEAFAHSMINKVMNIPVMTLKSVARSQDNQDFSRIFSRFYDNFSDLVSAALQSYEDHQDTQSLRDRTRQLLQRS